MKALRLQVTLTQDLMGEAVQISLSYGITAYDGCYFSIISGGRCPLRYFLLQIA
ncbi:MAG: hypothetical protein GDA44_13810 [Prochloron sp. SP5CPC1]|nr:hypothetical protein [Candidatus Paraprochloron terpiosi SP5CPC1]